MEHACASGPNPNERPKRRLSESNTNAPDLTRVYEISAANATSPYSGRAECGGDRLGFFQRRFGAWFARGAFDDETTQSASMFS
uniref:Uncharacterized protein n=1 Tax=Plectus sambesii TaxID=2011161 RepID=A0A914X9M0_9BILA